VAVKGATKLSPFPEGFEDEEKVLFLRGRLSFSDILEVADRPEILLGEAGKITFPQHDVKL
jgi:hypothetical protein